MPETTETHYVGLDVAKAQLDYALSETENGTVSNDPQGHARLIELLRRGGRCRVVCEATGGYERPIVAACLEAGIEICVVQPARARAFARSEGLMAKTDRIDAHSLRRYGQHVDLHLAKPPDPAVVQLRELIERRRDLIARLVCLDNQCSTAGPTLKALIVREQKFLKKESQRLEEAITEHIESHPQLGQKYHRLQQLKGAGPVLAATVLAYVPELGTLPDNTISALVGVAPYPRDSAKTKRPRHIRGGRGPVRHVLYMAAVSASRSNPILRDFYLRLHHRGKPKQLCLIAVMRKMLIVLNRLLANPNFCLAS